MLKKIFPKKYISIPILVMLVVILGLLGMKLFHQWQKQSQPPIAIMIATDMHLLAKEYTGDFFYEPSAAFDGKLTHYSNEYFDAFLAEVLEQKPNLLILSGDLTLNGDIKSHEEMAKKLDAVQNAGVQVLVIPGNHDVGSSSYDYSTKPEPTLTESLFANSFGECYENFGLKQALSRDSASCSYIYEASPYLRIIMLDTNTSVKGQVHPDTLTWLEAELRSAKLAGADVISVSHQNLHIHSPLLYFTYQFYNADELYELYEKYDVAVNISGHIHVQSIVQDKIPEIAVGSIAVPDSNYGKIVYNGKTIDYSTHSTDVEDYAKSQNWTNPDLLNYKEYCQAYFEGVVKEQTYNSFSESSLSQAEIELLAETYSKINSAYFSGNPIVEKEFETGFALWRKQTDSFILRYIESMIEESQTDNRSITIRLN